MINEKYLENGQKVNVIEIVGSRWLVEPVMYCEHSEDEFLGSEFIAEKVYDSAPIGRYSDKVESLNSEIDQKRDELLAINCEIKESALELKNLYSDLQKIPALKYIKSVIDGDFKYFVNMDDYNGPSIKDSMTLIDSDGDRHDSDQKLLTLFGRTGGNLQWRLNRYSDGSGSSSGVMPFMEMDEAVEYTRLECVKYLEEIAERRWKPWAGVRKAEWLANNGFQVPANYTEVYSEYKSEEDAKRRVKISEGMEVFSKELKEIELRGN